MWFNPKKKCGLVWVNQATNQISWMKGQLESFYWEQGFDADVIIFDSSTEALAFAEERVKVPFKIKLPPRGK